MSALSVLGANLITPAMTPLTQHTGGSSQSNPSAGGGSATGSTPVVLKKITTTDKAGAGILTFLVACGIIGGGVWIIL